MRHLHCCGMRLEMIVDPSREDGRFHGHCPRLGKRLHPHVQRQSCGGYRTCCVDTATAVLHAVADRFLVNIQTDVAHSLHGGASLVVSESAWSLSSAFLHQSLLHDLFIQTTRPEPWDSLRADERRNPGCHVYELGVNWQAIRSN